MHTQDFPDNISEIHQVCLQVNHSHTPLQSHINASWNCIKLCQVDIHVFGFWSQSISILDQGFTAFHNDTSSQGACINLCSKIVPITVPITLCQILLCQSAFKLGGSCTSSFQPIVTEFAHHFINVFATWNHPHTSKCPVNFPHREKMLWQVSTLGSGGRLLPQLHYSLPHSS